MQLPIYKIKDKFYFLDRRLNEYRNVKNPNDRIEFYKGSDMLQTPTLKDSRKLEAMGL